MERIEGNVRVYAVSGGKMGDGYDLDASGLNRADRESRNPIAGYTESRG